MPLAVDRRPARRHRRRPSSSASSSPRSSPTRWSPSRRRPFVALSKFVSSLVIGLFFLVNGAILADNYRDDAKKFAAVSGVTYALVNAGFSVGIGLSGAPFIPQALRGKYATSVAFSTAALATALVGVRESLPPSERRPFQARAFNPFAFTRLVSASPTMRLLAACLALALAPLFMGDTLQVFAIRQWGLTPTQVAQLFGGIGISGIISNVLGGGLIKRFGLQAFTALATTSTLVMWAGFASGSLKAAIVCAVVGFLGPARTLGATTMITAEGARLGIPQGQLSGDRANLVAWLKVLGPLVYGQLYLHGVQVGLPSAPFFLNVVLALLALILGPYALSRAAASTA